MKTDSATPLSQSHIMIGYARLSEVVATTIVTALIFGFYMAHYAWSTGFFTSAFTPLLATLFFASVLFVIVNSITKTITPRRDITALVELIGAVLFLAVAAWFFVSFPLNFAHVADVMPAQFQFVLSWLNNDVGRLIVALVLLAGVIALAVDSVKLAWRVTVRQFRQVGNIPPSP